MLCFYVVDDIDNGEVRSMATGTVTDEIKWHTEIWSCTE